MTGIHPTAIIGDGAKIHDTAQIGPYAVIGGNVKIGAGTKVGAHAVIDGYTTIGEDCNIFASACVGLEPQDLSYKNEPTGVIIGDRVTLREFVTVHRGTGDRFTTIGDDCFFMNYVHIAHDCQMGKGVILANSATFGGHCHVGDFAVAGGLVVFHQHVHVGRMVMIGGITGTRQDLPPFSTCDNRPARVVGLNLVGMKRQKFAPATRTAIKEAYKLIYRSGLNTTAALAKIEAELPKLPEIAEIVEFFRTSKRGVVKGAFDEESSQEDG
jgi:UDP-N-acetylglucosamine acyltransferase